MPVSPTTIGVVSLLPILTQLGTNSNSNVTLVKEGKYKFKLSLQVCHCDRAVHSISTLQLSLASRIDI